MTNAQKIIQLVFLKGKSLKGVSFLLLTAVFKS